jgi:hypothetical protein
MTRSAHTHKMDRDILALLEPGTIRKAGIDDYSGGPC